MPEVKRKRVAILGTRGIPARHGGFETFAEKLACHLVAQGWDVTVYCQESEGGAARQELWHGVRLVHIPVRRDDPVNSVIFDWKSTWAAARDTASHGGVILTLGYNTALFGILYRMRGISNLVNMDGLEWKRRKWSLPVRGWFYLNERIGCWLGNHLIADHPEICRHLATRVSERKITTIPYGADLVAGADETPVREMGLVPGEYVLLVARLEPENSVLDVITAFSRRPRGVKLVVVGPHAPHLMPYHQELVDAAGPEVVFVGGVYDRDRLQALRFHARLYVHGHRVGGTNPSLVEAMASSSAILAHDNPFNRWVAGPDMRYFASVDECEEQMAQLLEDSAIVESMKTTARERYLEHFTWDRILDDYETLLGEWLPRGVQAVTGAADDR